MGLLPYEFKSYNVIKVEFPWLEKTVDSVISYLKTKDKFFLGTFEEAKIKQKNFLTYTMTTICFYLMKFHMDCGWIL